MRLIILLLFSLSLRADVIIVKHRTGGGSFPSKVQGPPPCAFALDATSYSCTTNSAVTAGNTIFVAQVQEGGTAVAFAAPTAPCVTTFTAGDAMVSSPDRPVTGRWWSGTVTTGGSTCTVTMTNTHSSGIVEWASALYEISGTSATDGACSGTTSGTNTTPAVCSAAITPTANDLVIAFTFSTDNPTWTPGTGYASDLDLGLSCPGGTTSCYGSSESGNFSTATTPSYAPAAGEFWIIMGAAFRP